MYFQHLNSIYSTTCIRFFESLFVMGLFANKQFKGFKIMNNKHNWPPEFILFPVWMYKNVQCLAFYNHF